MTAAYLLGLAVLVLLLIGGVFGQRVLGRLEPVLALRPRLGIALWLVAGGVWAGLFLALGPVLAWFGSRQVLSGQASEVCQRCLAAANPFGPASGTVANLLPAAVFVVIPVLVVAALGARGLLAAVLSGRALRRHGRTLDVVGSIRPDDVWVLPERTTAAYSIALGRGRVVLTQGTLDALDESELTAVIAHERAHLRQRHHAILAWTRLLARAFSWVPLMRSAAPVVAQYAEMAADDVAARAVSSRVTVARALAKLQLLSPTSVASPGGGRAHSSGGAVALHAARAHVPSRVRRLLDDAAATNSTTRWFAAVGGYLLASLGLILAAGSPYIAVIVTGTC